MAQEPLTPDDVLSLWLGTIGPDGSVDPAIETRWFTKDEAFDAMLRERFGGLVEDAIAGRLAAWEATPRGRLAVILLLDQLARNIHRGTARMFEGDARALALATAAVDDPASQELALLERAFAIMPFMHAESVEAQVRGEALFEALEAEARRLAAPEAVVERCASFLHYHRLHRVIVERFGRFPHRNVVLGRDTTPEELAFLAEPNSSF